MRLFVSVRLSPEMKKCVRSHMSSLKQVSLGGRYPGEENYHITLAFIGEYNDLAKVKSALEKVKFEPINVTAGGIGHFGNVYYVPVKSEARALDVLAENVKLELEHAGVPFDRKKFKAHITIGRDIECAAVPSISDTATMQVSEFSLMRSDYIAGKRIYKSLFTVCAQN